MGKPCYEAFESHLILEQIDTVDNLYCGNSEGISKKAFAKNSK